MHIKFNLTEAIEQEEENAIGYLGMMMKDNVIINKTLEHNKESKKYFELLYKALSVIKEQCESFELNEVGDDFSFELTIRVSKEKQGEVFYNVLNMKNSNDTISEISINMQSLENILTSIENA